MGFESMMMVWNDEIVRSAVRMKCECNVRRGFKAGVKICDKTKEWDSGIIELRVSKTMDLVGVTRWSGWECDNLQWPEFGVAELGLKVNESVR
jgi:hypothetical protein